MSKIQSAIEDLGFHNSPHYLKELGYTDLEINKAVQDGELRWTRDGNLEIVESAQPSTVVHVTAIRNGTVWGHSDEHCDPGGCAAGDVAYSEVSAADVEIGRVYEISAGKVLAEIE